MTVKYVSSGNIFLNKSSREKPNIKGVYLNIINGSDLIL